MARETESRCARQACATATNIGSDEASASAGYSLRRFAIVVLEQAAEASAAGDIGKRNQVGLPLSFLAAWHRQLVVQALVGPLGVIMLEKLLAEVIHVPLTEHHEVIEAFLL